MKNFVLQNISIYYSDLYNDLDLLCHGLNRAVTMIIVWKLDNYYNFKSQESERNQTSIVLIMTLVKGTLKITFENINTFLFSLNSNWSERTDNEIIFNACKANDNVCYYSM